VAPKGATFILGSVKPCSSGRGYKRLGSHVTGESFAAQCRFQDVDWGSTTRGSEVRWRPEDAFPVASDSVRPLPCHREPKGQEGSSLAPRLSRYQAQPFASRDIATGWNAHSKDTTTAKGDISYISIETSCAGGAPLRMKMGSAGRIWRRGLERLGYSVTLAPQQKAA
jgi:hypothetical protein